MRRALALTVVIGLAGALALVWRCRSDQSQSPPAQRLMSKTQHAKRVARTARGSIAGTVVDEAKAPIAGASMCLAATSDDVDPELLRQLPCVTSDARGAFTFAPLLPARYTVFASMASYQPKQSDEIAVDSAPAVVTLTLERGGVEITGTVTDLTGGPIAKARVASRDAIVETLADGRFSLWVAPGLTSVVATADGYAMARDNVHAPGRVDLFLIPEGSSPPARSPEPCAAGTARSTSSRSTCARQRPASRVTNASSAPMANSRSTISRRAASP